MKKLIAFFMLSLVSTQARAEFSFPALFASSRQAPDAKKSKNTQETKPECLLGNGWTVSGDFLWWRASENLSEYAQVVTKENVIGVGNDTSGFPKGHNEQISYAWDPGFSLRAGWMFDYDCWDLLLGWTWYHNHTKNHTSSQTGSDVNASTGLVGTNNGLGIYGSWLGEWLPAYATTTLSDVPLQLVSPGPFSKAHLDWKLEYDTVNMEFGKSFITRSNLLRPFFGLRGATITRTAEAKYSGYHNLGSLLTAVPNFFGFINAEYKTQMDFWGMGPTLGVSDEFRLPHGWRFTGQLAASLLYGRLHAYEKFLLNDLSQGVGSLFGGSKFNNHEKWSPSTNIQMRFGLDWAMHFDKNTKEFLLGAAWEQNVWFFHGYGAEIDKGIMNLWLGGLTTTVQFRF